MDPGTKAAGNGFDRRQGIVDLMPDHPDKALEGVALLLAQGNTHVGEDQERVRDAALTETGSSYHPMDGIALAGKDEDPPIRLIQHVGKLQIIGARAPASP